MIVRSRIIPGLSACDRCRLDARGRRDTRRGCRRALHQGRVGRVPAQATTHRAGRRRHDRRQGRRAKLTPFIEREVNAYLRYELRDQVPAGIAEPTITIVGDGRVSGRAVVDLDAVKRREPVDLVVRSDAPAERQAAGHRDRRARRRSRAPGRFVLESATISGIPVPKSVLQQVVSYYSRSAGEPDGIDLDDAFELPAQIREIRVQPGQAHRRPMTASPLVWPVRARASARAAARAGASIGRSPTCRASARAAPPISRGRPRHRSKICCCDFPSATRIAASPQPHRRAETRRARRGRRRSHGAELKRTRRPGFTIFEVRVRDDSGTLTRGVGSISGSCATCSIAVSRWRSSARSNRPATACR